MARKKKTGTITLPTAKKLVKSAKTVEVLNIIYNSLPDKVKPGVEVLKKKIEIKLKG